jgi:cytochrome c
MNNPQRVAILLSLFAAFGASSASAQGGDAENGKKLYASQCAACHSIKEGVNLVGPNLAKIFGRKAGSVPNFRYSPALRDSGIVWDEAALDKWLINPREDVPGNHMPYPGVPDAQKRADLIAYLKTL